MLKELAQYIVGLSEPHIAQWNGKEYSDRKFYDVSEFENHLAPAVLHTTTLTSIVDFIEKNVDEETDFPLDRIIIHIMQPNKVLLTSEVTETGARWDRVLAEINPGTFKFGQFMDRETFNINLQTLFLPDEGRASLLGLIGKISDGAITEGEDDGITQRVTVRQGIQRVGNADVPNPVFLTPFRMFPEAVQPQTPFVFRLQPGRGEGAMPTCALFEADGSGWRLEAMQNIAAWLYEHLPQERLENGEIVIIA